MEHWQGNGTKGKNHRIFKGEVQAADWFSHFTSLSEISETQTLEEFYGTALQILLRLLPPREQQIFSLGMEKYILPASIAQCRTSFTNMKTIQNWHLRKMHSFKDSLALKNAKSSLWGEFKLCFTLREIQVYIAERLFSTLVQIISLGATLPVFETWFYHLLVLWISMCLGFLIHKIGIIILPNS